MWCMQIIFYFIHKFDHSTLATSQHYYVRQKDKVELLIRLVGHVAHMWVRFRKNNVHEGTVISMENYTSSNNYSN